MFSLWKYKCSLEEHEPLCVVRFVETDIIYSLIQLLLPHFPLTPSFFKQALKKKHKKTVFQKKSGSWKNTKPLVSFACD